MDFMHEQLEVSMSFRLLSVIDDFYREDLGIEVGFSLPSERIIRVLRQIIALGGNRYPNLCRIRPGNVIVAITR